MGVRVLDETGQGDYETVIQGIQWVINHKHEYNIKVMNLSLNGVVSSPYWADPLDQAVTKAWSEGITVVVAALQAAALHAREPMRPVTDLDVECRQAGLAPAFL